MQDRIAEIIETNCPFVEQWDTSECAAKIIAALSDKVQLEWEQQDETENNCWTASAFGLEYEAGVDVEGQAYWGFFRSVFTPDVLVIGGLGDAKAAGQAGYTRRILSAFGIEGET